MRKLARMLRKWADLIDPGVRPSTECMTVRIACDKGQALNDISEVTAALHEVIGLSVVAGLTTKKKRATK